MMLAWVVTRDLNKLYFRVNNSRIVNKMCFRVTWKLISYKYKVSNGLARKAKTKYNSRVSNSSQHVTRLCNSRITDLYYLFFMSNHLIIIVVLFLLQHQFFFGGKCLYKESHTFCHHKIRYRDQVCNNKQNRL